MGATASQPEHPIIKYAKQVLLLSGDIIECGSYNLDSALRMGAVCPEKLVYACDTFTGMPAPGPEDGHREGDFRTTWDYVWNMAQDTNVVPVPGLFQDTLPLLVESIGKVSMVYIDCDLYESAKFAIDTLWPHLNEGGLLVVDDYANPACKGIKKLMDNLFAGRFTPDDQNFCAVRKP